MRTIKCPCSKKPGGPTDDDCISCEAIDEACKVLDKMGLVVYPTDTVYGLAALALYPEAVEKVYRAKGRPMNIPVSVAVSSYEGLTEMLDVTMEQAKILDKLTGEPITWVLPALDYAPKKLMGKGRTLGVRILTTGCAAAIINRVGPITSPSANRHGEKSPTTSGEALASLKDSVDLYIDCGKTKLGVPSTVVQVKFEGAGTDIDEVNVIREGAIDGETIERKMMEWSGKGVVRPSERTADKPPRRKKHGR